jgi:AraC family transcriptional regulator
MVKLALYFLLEHRGEGDMFHTVLVGYKQHKVRAYIEEHLTEVIKLSELCAVANLSEVHFHRVFKETFGMTPYAYILKRRIEFACDMLKTTSFPSYRIATECGFYDISHFSKYFRRIIGQSPAEWRNGHAATMQ